MGCKSVHITILIYYTFRKTILNEFRLNLTQCLGIIEDQCVNIIFNVEFYNIIIFFLRLIYMLTFGSRAEVWHGNAKKTTGGLSKNDLIKNKHGEIVSKKKHFTAKKEKRLEKAGYFTQKGKFGYVKRDKKTRKTKSKSKR